jgi:hypothetical protein
LHPLLQGGGRGFETLSAHPLLWKSQRLAALPLVIPEGAGRVKGAWPLFFGGVGVARCCVEARLVDPAVLVGLVVVGGRWPAPVTGWFGTRVRCQSSLRRDDVRHGAVRLQPGGLNQKLDPLGDAEES